MSSPVTLAERRWLESLSPVARKAYNAASPEEKQQMLDLAKVRLPQPWCVQKPHPKQEEFLLRKELEVLYGGSAGGAKSSALLLAALQYADVPQYNAIIFRRSYKQLEMAGGLIHRSHEWLHNTKAKWNSSTFSWTFPSGSMLKFAYLDKEGDHLEYQGSNWSFIAFDELTHFRESDYLYLFSRHRQGAGVDIPTRIRCTANPGGPGHCVPYGDVLTPAGWKDIWTMRPGDPVFTVDDSGEMVESVVDQFHESDYEGEIIDVSARGLRMVCTPNHGVAKIDGVRGAGRGAKFSVIPFEDLPGQAYVLRRVEWKGKPLSDFQPPASPILGVRYQQPQKLPIRLFLSLLGWYLSEGFCHTYDKAFTICQKKPHQRPVIAALLLQCGFVFSAISTGFPVYCPTWSAYFRQFGYSQDKFIPAWVKDGSIDDLNALFLAMMAGDGHWTEEGRLDSGVYYTISKQLADDVCEICLKMGYLVYVHVRNRGGQHKRSYEISFKRSKRGGTEILTGHHIYDVNTLTKRKSQITREHVKTKVCCIGVPDTHTFIIRQHGSVWVSGNSWVRNRFIPPLGQSIDWNRVYVYDCDAMVDGRILKWQRAFVPARLEDNPSLDYDAYLLSLANLDPITRAQLLSGDWDAYAGGRFMEEWFTPSFRFVANEVWELAKPEPTFILSTADGRTVRYRKRHCTVFVICDPAATEKQTADWTAIGAFAVCPNNELLVLESVRGHFSIHDIAYEVSIVCSRWGATWMGVESISGFRGVFSSCERFNRWERPERIKRGQYPGTIPTVRALGGRVSGKVIGQSAKLARATPAIIRAQNGMIYLPEKAKWKQEWISEMVRFTGEDHCTDDQVDVLSHAVVELDRMGSGDYPKWADTASGTPDYEREGSRDELPYERYRRHAAEKGILGLGDRRGRQGGGHRGLFGR